MSIVLRQFPWQLAMEDLILKQGGTDGGGECRRTGGGCKGPRTGPSSDEVRIC